MAYEVIIYEPEINDGIMLSQHFGTMGNYQIKAVFTNPEHLLQYISNATPSIVFANVNSSEENVPQFIKKLKEKLQHSNLILTSSEKNFDLAYAAVKYKANDFLLKPIQKDDLQECLKNLIHLNYYEDQLLGPVQMVRAYFIQELARNLINSTIPVHEINKKYGTNFQAGYIRFAYIKLDSTQNITEVSDDAIALILSNICNYTSKLLSNTCYDVVINPSVEKCHIQILVNYPKELETYVQSLFLLLHEYVTSCLAPDKSFRNTLCMSTPHDSIHHIIYTEREAGDSMWARLFYPDRSVIDSPIIEGTDPDTQVIIDNYRSILNRALEEANIDGMEEVIHELFLLPQRILLQHNMRIFFKHFPEMLASSHRHKNEFSPEIGAALHTVEKALERSSSLEQYKKTLIRGISTITGLIYKGNARKNSSTVSAAIDYINKNYTQPIQLNDVAEAISVNASYLSSIFKKEIGMNFTKYLNTTRIRAAKNLLRSSNEVIEKIANAVGFSDVCYFNRVFKKVTGLTPGLYRKFYS